MMDGADGVRNLIGVRWMGSLPHPYIPCNTHNK